MSMRTNKEILAVVNQMVSDGQIAQDVVEKYFPELRESKDERIRKELIEFIKSRGGFKGEWIAWLEKQQKPAEEYNITGIDSKNAQGKLGQMIRNIKPLTWSLEDEIGLTDTMWAVKQARTIAKDENDMGSLWNAERWLKSLKDRVQPLPKREWSEEDEEIRKSIIDIIERRRMSSIGSESAMCENQIDFLKSLRPQKQWKPSDAQMVAMQKATVDLCGKDEHNIITCLYYDLKKLREE